MKLIQQAVERAGQMEREGKPMPSPLRPLGSLHGVQSRSFRPTPMTPSRAPLATAGLAVLATVCGALLYVALVRSQAHGEIAAPPQLAHASPAAPEIAVVKAVAAVPGAAAKPAAPLAADTPAATPTPQALALATAATPVPAEAPGLTDARATIESWARAWSERDVSGYLAHYGEGFAPDRGASRSVWEKSRRQMIERRRSIVVSVANLRLEQVSDKRIVARYAQDYAADTYRETGTLKRLVLERESSGWRIVAETADTADAADTAGAGSS